MDHAVWQYFSMFENVSKDRFLIKRMHNKYDDVRFICYCEQQLVCTVHINETHQCCHIHT